MTFQRSGIKRSRLESPGCFVVFFLRKKKSGIGHSKRWRPWSDRWSWRLQVGSFGADRQLISGVVLLFHPCKWPKINGFRWGEITFTYNLQARICLFLVIFCGLGSHGMRFSPSNQPPFGRACFGTVSQVFFANPR